MATGMEWLQKQKKAELSEVASQVGLKRYVAFVPFHFYHQHHHHHHHRHHQLLLALSILSPFTQPTAK